MARRPAKAHVAAAWRSFWETPEGRAAIGDMMRQFGVYTQIPAGDATAMAIAVGERNVCTWIAAQIAMRPESFVEDLGTAAAWQDRHRAPQPRSEMDEMVDSITTQYGAYR